MKKQLLIFFTLLNAITQAQQFAPTGAQWHYEVINGGGQQVGFIKFSVDGDTTLNNLTYQKIKRNQALFLLLREENDKVYWHHAPTNSDRIFFDRNPSVGDIWNYPYDDPIAVNFPYQGNFTNPVDSIGLRVVSVADTTFNNLPAKRIQFSKRTSVEENFTTLPGELPAAYLAYSPFGFFQTFFLLGSGAFLDNEFPVRLRCYEDAYWGLIHFNTTIACDSTWLTTGLAQLPLHAVFFDVYPNPAEEYLVVKFNDQEQQGKSCQISIMDMQGRIMQNITCVNDGYDAILSLQGYTSGTYLIHIQQNGKRVGSKLFVKH